jgi:hypothetical protein
MGSIGGGKELSMWADFVFGRQLEKTNTGLNYI